MTRRLAAISIDLDEVALYARIHGAATRLTTSSNAVYDRCVPRLTEWLDRKSIRATFFVVGSDLERPENRRRIKSLRDAGHEIANHSYHHLYDLVRRPESEVHREVERAAEAIADACGTWPVGFRAPGYTVSDTLFRVLESAGVRYDSSVFPCPTYYLAKAAAVAVIKLRGRSSASIVDTPRVLGAPRRVYRVGKPYWRDGRGLIEIPIGVTRLQLPYIGTSLVMGGQRVASWLTRQMLGQELINLELHGFDAADVERDDLHGLARHRPDPKRDAFDKLRALSVAVDTMRNAGYELVPLCEAAERLTVESNP